MHPTREQRVLNLLKLRANQWIDSADFNHPAIGGEDGKRRMRSLRAKGHVIEKRVKADQPKNGGIGGRLPGQQHEYRLVLPEAVPTGA